LKFKVILYTLLLLNFVFWSSLYKHVIEDEPLGFENPWALLIVPVFAFFIWLRWDWAYARRRRNREKMAEQELNEGREHK